MLVRQQKCPFSRSFARLIVRSACASVSTIIGYMRVSMDWGSQPAHGEIGVFGKRFVNHSNRITAKG
jgi:hypothetical protein